MDRSDARAYRMLVLRSHYRSPIEVTPGTIADAEAGLARLDELARRFDLADRLAEGPVVDGVGTEGLDAEAVDRFRQAMDDDLDTPGALAAVFELVRRANAADDAGDTDGAATNGGHRRLPVRCSGPRPPSPADHGDRSGQRRSGGPPRPGPVGPRLGRGRLPAWSVGSGRLGGGGQLRGDPDPSPLTRRTPMNGV